jgi:ketosteroid isomerase-like protein
MIDGMRRRIKGGIAIGAAGFLGLTALAAQAGVPFNDPADVKAINDIETALATQTDMDVLIDYYAPDAFVEDIIAPGLYRGRKQIHDSFAKQFEPVKAMKGAVQDINILSDGKLACAAVRVAFDTEMKDGSKLAMSVRQLDVYKRIGGKWQIIQEQTSVPMDSKTGMAVMNATLPVRGSMPWSDNPFPGPAMNPEKAKAELKHWVVTGSPIVDVDQMVALLGPDKEALLYDLTTPGEYRGAAEVRAAYYPSMSQLASAKIQLLDFVADSDGVFGAQTDTQNLQIVGKDGSVKVISFRETDCYHRIDGQWKSFFESLSFPVDSKTGKAVTTDPKAKFD